MALVPMLAVCSTESRLKGSVDEPRVLNGGSTRVKGADTRRFFEMPACLRPGDRPAGAVRGVRGELVFALAGVARREVKVGGGIDFVVLREKAYGLTAPSEASLLLFLDGEKRVGSIFSESLSSYVEGVNARFIAGLDGASIGLPRKGELFATKPAIFVSCCTRDCQSVRLMYHSDDS